MVAFNMRMESIPMSVHVRFETPTEVSDKIYEMIQANSNGRIKKGSNEVTKTAERGTAQFIVLAEDVNPPELLAHIPLICEEKGIPYGMFLHKNTLRLKLDYRKALRLHQ